jgi:hypothetical protein
LAAAARDTAQEAQMRQLTDDELERAVSALKAMDEEDRAGAERVARFVHDVVRRQAEGRALLSGEKYVAARAEEHGLSRDHAGTPLGNAIEILERGPDTNLRWALISALYVRGFALRVADEDGPSRQAACQRLVEQCDWLELCTPHRALGLVPKLLEGELVTEICAALARAVLTDDGTRTIPAVRARNAARISALAAAAADDADDDAAREALERIGAQAQDPFSRALSVLVLRGDGVDAETSGADEAAAAAEAEESLQGRLGRFPGGPLRSLLRWLTGWALLSWAVRLLMAILGLRRRAQILLRGDAVTIRRELALLGRPLSSSEQTVRLSELRFARRAARYPMLHLLVGVTSFAVGIFLGALLLADGLRAGDLTLLLLAAGLWLGGAGLDLALDVLASGWRGRVALDLDLGRGTRTRVSGVELARADRFLHRLAQRLAVEPTT